MKQKFLILTLVLLLFFTFATPALAQGPEGGVFFGENLTLAEGEKIKGDVVIFGGNITMSPSSEIKGDVVVFGGNANIDGKIDGDVAMLGGNINLGETAVIDGDIGLAGGNVTRAEGAKVTGKISNLGGSYEGEFDAPPIPSFPPPPEPPEFPGWHESSSWVDGPLNFFRDIARTIGVLIALAAVSWVIATFMPQQMKTVSDTVADATLVSSGVGLLTTFLALVSILLVFTICLAFIPALAGLFVGIAALFGWIVIGQMIGERLLVSAGQPFPNFVSSTVVGVVVLTIVAKMPILSWLPCIGPIFCFIGFLVFLAVGLTGLGAVILTRFGTRPYYPSSYTTPGNPPPPPPRPRARSYGSEEDFSDLDVASASEAELKAKIKAALDEVDEIEDAGEEEPEAAPAEEKPKPKKRTTRKKPAGKKAKEPTPEPEEPAPDTPDDESKE